MKRTTWIALMCIGAMGTFCSSCEDKDIITNIDIRKDSIPPEPTDMKYVDLGLPSGTKWALCNLGATSPNELGITITGKGALTIDYTNWRLPIEAELEELIDNCNWEWDDKGFVVTSKGEGFEDCSIFLPAKADAEVMYWSSTTYYKDEKYFLASLEIKYDSIRNCMIPPEINTNELSDTTRYPVRLVYVGK